MTHSNEAYTLIKQMIEERYNNARLGHTTVSIISTYDNGQPTITINADITVVIGSKNFKFSASAPSPLKLITQLEQTLP